MQFKRKIIASLLIGGGVLSLSGQASANDSDELEQLRALVQQLDQKIRVLDRKAELAEEDAAKKKKETPIVKASEKGFGLESADGQNSIRLRGLLQADDRYFSSGKNLTQKAASGASTAGYLDNTEDANNTALLRRARPTVEGTLFGKYDYRFTEEFGDGKSEVIDAYVDGRFTPYFQVRAGKFKPYVGLERLQSGADIKFIERSYVSNILPNRDVGVSVHGDVLNNKLSYAVGLFNGVVDGGDSTTSSDINKDKDYAARIFATPFKDSDSALAGLGIGFGGTYGNVNGKTKDTVNGSTTELTSGYKTEGQQIFFKYNDSSVLRSGIGELNPASTINATNGSQSGTTPSAGPGTSWLVHADGTRYRFSPQVNYYYGPFGLLGEYVLENQEISVGQKGLKKITLNNDAWQVAATYLLTGEDASYKGVKPKRNFDLDNGGWGAWEVVGRYNEQNLDKDAFTFGNLGNGAGITANQKTGYSGSAAATVYNLNHYLYADPKASAKSAKTWTGGINWYLNSDVKISLNYEQTSFDGGGGDLESSYGSPTTVGPKQRKATFYDLVHKGQILDREDERALLARFQVAF